MSVVQELVTRYSEFINFPISLWSSTEVDVPAPDEEVEEESDEAPDTGMGDRKEWQKNNCTWNT